MISELFPSQMTHNINNNNNITREMGVIEQLLGEEVEGAVVGNISNNPHTNHDDIDDEDGEVDVDEEQQC